MSFANLTTSGWVLFALTLLMAFRWIGHLVFLALRVNKRNADDVYAGAFFLAILIPWLLYLVTP